MENFSERQVVQNFVENEVVKLVSREKEIKCMAVGYEIRNFSSGFTLILIILIREERILKCATLPFYTK